MKNYFYIRNNEKHGPLEKADLQKQNLDKDTLIWCEGMIDWQPLDKIEDLKDVSNKLPPPIPLSKLKNKETHQEDDEKYYAGLVKSYFRYKVLIRALKISIPFAIIFFIIQPFSPNGIFPVYLTEWEKNNLELLGLKFYLMGLPLYLGIAYLVTLLKFKKSEIPYEKLEDIKSLYIGILATIIIAFIVAIITSL